MELESQATGKENAPQARIKELQQELEDAKSYYMKQIAGVQAKKMPESKAGEEVARLQSVLLDKDREISQLKEASSKGARQAQIKKPIGQNLENIPERDELDFDREEPEADAAAKFKTIKKGNDIRSTTMNVGGPKEAWGEPGVKASPSKQFPAAPFKQQPVSPSKPLPAPAGISPAELAQAKATAADLSQQLITKQTMFEQQASKFENEL